jgi:hypothetical protein
MVKLIFYFCKVLIFKKISFIQNRNKKQQCYRPTNTYLNTVTYSNLSHPNTHQTTNSYLNAFFARKLFSVKLKCNSTQCSQVTVHPVSDTDSQLPACCTQPHPNRSKNCTSAYRPYSTSMAWRVYVAVCV